VIGQIVGSYRISDQLGQGGMGVVYRAEHIQLGRPAALKVLLPQLSGDAQIVQRFWNEARAASSIDHPGIVEVYDFGRHTDGSAYLVMELLKGESLDHRLMRPMPPLEAASLIAQVAGALAAAHAQGIVHRDLKPDNIFLVPNELLPGGIQVKLLDFGIAKLADERASGFRTQTGVLIGTPAYMSPEQCMGRSDLDHRTDLYSVGCIMFHMLCGRPPFYSDQGTGVMIAMHLRDPVPDPRTLAPHLPQPLVAIMLRLLEKDPAARYQSAQELRQALVTAGAVAPLTSPPAGAVPDPYGATMAPVPAPLSAASAARSGAPSMPGPMGGFGPGPGAMTAPGSHGAGYAPTTAGSHGAGYAQATAGSHGAGYAPMAAGPAMPVGASPTTHSGAAAELMTRPDRARHRGRADAGGRSGRGKAAWVVVGALLIAGGGIAAGVALTSGGSSGGSSDGSGEPQPSAQAGSGNAPLAVAGLGSGSGGDHGPDVASPEAGSGSQAAKPAQLAPVPPEQPPDTSGGPPCPTGQLRTDDTHGECCWAGQAWSTPKKRCIGAPTCPPGTRARARDEDCIVVADPARPGPQIATDDPLAAAPPELQLAATSLDPGATLEIRLSQPLRSRPGHYAWVTVAPAGSPQTAYGTWKYVDDGARRATLAAPSKPGAYEVRLHTNYPAKAFNVVRAAPFAVTAPVETPSEQSATPLSGQRFTLDAQAVRGGEKVGVRFPGSLRPLPGEQFWITVIEAGSSDSSWGKWEYVPKGARSVSLGVPPKAGAYEVRLHANYPKKSANVVFRAPLQVDAN
jgi:serine/threonine-protein kinase